MAEEDNADCGIPNTCKRIIPWWLVALDNIPTFVLFVLGTMIVWWFWKFLAIVFFIYCIISIVLFWYLICPYCHHYNTKACPCGYGSIASKCFKTKSKQEKHYFRVVFRRNIVIMFPCWFTPLILGLFLLLTAYSLLTLVIFIIFCLDGFLFIPAISIFVGCKKCEVKADCPWISK